MKCECGVELSVEGNNSYDELGLDGEGVLIVYSCHNKECNIHTVLAYEDEN